MRDWVDRANQIYSKLGAVRAGNPPEFKWPSGAIFRTGHLKDEQAYTKYQGHEYQRMLIEELTQIPLEESYLRLLASCRSTVPTLKSQIFCTTNPGELGHGWVKGRFIDPMPPGKTYHDPVSGRSRIFIKSLIDDNPTLMNNDPDYVKSLEALKKRYPELYRAWRWGDWDIFVGQIFREFNREKHVIRQITPRTDMPHYLWMDWGLSKPFAAYASAVVRMKEPKTGEVFNRVVTYQEWYDVEKTPDVWAELIYKTARCRNFKKAMVDPDMLNRQKDQSVSIGKAMMRKWKDLRKGKSWVFMEAGNNKRKSQVPIMKNWLSIAPDGLPYWLITDNCLNLIRTLPLLVYDKHKVEEIDTDQEDHAADACSYGLKAVKFISVVGSFGSKDRIARFRRFRPMRPLKLKDGKQEALDLDSFAVAKKKEVDWRSL